MSVKDAVIPNLTDSQTGVWWDGHRIRMERRGERSKIKGRWFVNPLAVETDS